MIGAGWGVGGGVPESFSPPNFRGGPHGLGHIPALISLSTVIRHVTNGMGLLKRQVPALQLNLNLGGSKAGAALAASFQCWSPYIILFQL